jgi:RpiB/LacA/LacB family sugar-phosphate isomerase
VERIAIASDHAGRGLKDDLKAYLAELGFEVEDMGVDSDDSVDYPDYGIPLAERVSRAEIPAGILVCGTGVGMSILANKFDNVRAALVGDLDTARMAKEHNNANILVIGARVTAPALAKDIIKLWHEASFEGGRHQRRLDKITEIEKRRK